MADYNRNRQDDYRQQYDWNDDYGRQQRNYEEEPNYTISENRGYRGSGRHGSMSSGDGGWQSRYEREMSTNREGDFERSHQRPFSRHRESDYGYGTGHRGLSSAYSDFGDDYPRGNSRNLYDRGDQGMGRRDFKNTENRLGGANYDRYGDRGRYQQGHPYGSHGEFSAESRGRSDYGRSGYGRSERGNDYGDRNYGTGDYRDRDYGRGESEDRSWWDRTSDEVSSWFGDDEAERRRERDRQMRGYRGKGPRNYTRSDDRMKEDINDRLSDDPFVDASDIDVSVSSGEVTLTGTVDHRSTKRRAEDLAEAVSGVRNVENRLRVAHISGNPGSGMNSPSGSTVSQSSSPIPGSERRTRETSQTTK
jgi:osmotically-inducible protein OsmY